MKIFTNISILLLLTACFLRVGAQKPMLTFNSYSAKNGLPSGTVTSLLKDSLVFCGLPRKMASFVLRVVNLKLTGTTRPIRAA